MKEYKTLSPLNRALLYLYKNTCYLYSKRIYNDPHGTLAIIVYYLFQPKLIYSVFAIWQLNRENINICYMRNGWE